MLEGVIFDVDGTLVDSERDGHRVAFNRAFEEFGLPDRWEPEHYGELLHTTGGLRRIDQHLAARRMPEAERQKLVPELHRRKTEIYNEMVAGGMLEPRPGARRCLEELRRDGLRLAVATTGTRAAIVPLIHVLFGDECFEVVITRDEAPLLKPDPSAYVEALKRLDMEPAAAIAVEDSRNGLISAIDASLRCVVLVNAYTQDQDLVGADLVMDGFGEPDAPARVLSDPHGVDPGGVLDPATLRRLAECDRAIAAAH